MQYALRKKAVPHQKTTVIIASRSSSKRKSGRLVVHKLSHKLDTFSPPIQCSESQPVQQEFKPSIASLAERRAFSVKLRERVAYCILPTKHFGIKPNSGLGLSINML